MSQQDRTALFEEFCRAYALYGPVRRPLSVEDGAWYDFLAQEFNGLVGGAVALEAPGAMDRLMPVMEARYALLSAEGGLHGDSILSSVDENAAGCRRRIEIRVYLEGHLNEPEVLPLWKTDGWVVLSHFEMTLRARNIRERLSKPHIRLRNRAVYPIDWDSRIPVEGGVLEIFGPQDACEGQEAAVPYEVVLKDAKTGDVLTVKCVSREAGWAVLADAFVALNDLRGGTLAVDGALTRVLDNGQLTQTGWLERMAVQAGDSIRISC
ncbi:hypothetical protein EV715DRAFT_295466 [Schizophyllum commune]